MKSICAICCVALLGCNVSVAPNSMPLHLTFVGKLSRPASDSLFPIFPNPFSRSGGDSNLAVTFTLRDSGSATLLIQNVIGDAIATYADSALLPGIYYGRWNPIGSDGTALNPGLYFITLRVRDYIDSRLVNIQNND